MLLLFKHAVLFFLLITKSVANAHLPVQDPATLSPGGGDTHWFSSWGKVLLPLLLSSPSISAASCVSLAVVSQAHAHSAIVLTTLRSPFPWETDGPEHVSSVFTHQSPDTTLG